ncbi:DUF2490 domain-containing protein [Mesonia maritima]|uniref:DUF2490 domain-containing protein n=1 Tax=Mesonia maritima TaxID=1793873 RepID=A0ABU1K4G6_9FLAO|nr:DUF2490 domain-containing protein [Mesonia maritima]MDR6299473.1 hypothetical protein [Mesonia maritima]
MIILFSKKFRFLFFFLILLFGKLSAQENFNGFINPAISVSIKNETPWSYTFGIARRDIVFTDIENKRNFSEEVKFEGQFLELNHFTSRKVGFYGKVSAGIRYRFIETFTGKQNETRFIEQYAYGKKLNRFKIAHRLRLAQRFREKTTFRTRYRFSVEFPLNGDNVDAKEFLLVTSAEGVWEFGKDELPNFGVRYSNYIGYKIFDNAVINLGLEYRYRNFTQNPYTQLFLISALKVSL